VKKLIIALLVAVLSVSVVTPALAADVDPSAQITVWARNPEKTAGFAKEITVMQGDVVELHMDLVNYEKSDVTLKFALPDTLQYVVGSAVLLGDRTLPDTLMTEQGFNLGEWGPNQQLEIRFSAVAMADHLMIDTDCITVTKFDGGYQIQIVSAIELPRTVRTITRLEFSWILAQRFAVEPHHTLPRETPWPFSDCIGWSAAWAFDRGLMVGCGDNKFCPDAFLTYEQFAVVLCRLANITPDAEKHNIQGGGIADWAGPSIVAIADYLDGEGNLCLFADDPKGAVTESFVQEMLDIVLR